MNAITDATKAVADLSRHFETAYRAGDARSLVEGYFVPDSDAPAAYPPGEPPVKGQAALEAMFAGMIKDVPQIRLETLDVVTSGSVAFEVGRAHLTGSAGEAMTGRYTVCFVHTDLGWRAKTDFFATDGWID